MTLILDLCGGTGAWSRPYAKAGYDVLVVDPSAMAAQYLKSGQRWARKDVRLFAVTEKVHGVLAAPPCTHFARAGARWWKEKGDAALLEGLELVGACLRIIHAVKPKWWCLENPTGRLDDYLGPPVMRFNPCDYGDPWTKRTCLWGKFNPPGKWNPVPATEGSKTTRKYGGPSERTKILRSITPAGFAKAFFEANP